MELNVGDVVVLKSGGPRMTIDYIGTFSGSQQQARCTWFVDGEIKKAVFDLATLELAPEVKAGKIQSHQGGYQ